MADTEIVRVKIELDLVNGKDFNSDNRSLSREELLREAEIYFADWLDAWCQDNENIYDYIQSRIINEN